MQTAGACLLAAAGGKGKPAPGCEIAAIRFMVFSFLLSALSPKPNW